MQFKMIHENYNVQDLDKSLKFYAEALDRRRISAICRDPAHCSFRGSF